MEKRYPFNPSSFICATSSLNNSCLFRNLAPFLRSDRSWSLLPIQNLLKTPYFIIPPIIVTIGHAFTILNNNFFVKQDGQLPDLLHRKRTAILQKNFCDDSSPLLLRSLQNYMSRADFFTFTTACTLIIINVCTEISNCNCL